MDTKAADQWAMGAVAQYHHVLTTNVKPLTVYAFNTNTGVKPPHHTAVYRSDDGGKTWRATFYPDPRFKRVQRRARTTSTAGVRPVLPGRAAAGRPSDPADPDHADPRRTACIATSPTTAGKTWLAGHTATGAGTDATERARPSASLGCATAWSSPRRGTTTSTRSSPTRHYICYTDIGFARSLDAGKTWIWWATSTSRRGRTRATSWRSTRRRRARSGARSPTSHDIPNDNIIGGRHRATGPGGVCVSTDFGATWKPSNDGPAGGAGDCRSCWTRRARRAAARSTPSVFGQGVYKSTDDGKTLGRRPAEGSGAAEQHARLPDRSFTATARSSC